MDYIGIDIGSTSAKTVVTDKTGTVRLSFTVPTGWSSFDAVGRIRTELTGAEINPDESFCVATGYGRDAVLFAPKKITEITCHARGAACLFGSGKMNVLDIGGQDMKVISCTDGRVEEFFMNDKCSAGTGRFIEIMANRLSLTLSELDRTAEHHQHDLSISSTCTVFAESEVVALAATGTRKEDISWGVWNLVISKVKQEYAKLNEQDRPLFLTGGLCDCSFFQNMLSQSLGREISTCPMARYAGAVGAAALAVQQST